MRTCSYKIRFELTLKQAVKPNSSTDARLFVVDVFVIFFFTVFLKNNSVYKESRLSTNNALVGIECDP